jgi:hypothetical protein
MKKTIYTFLFHITFCYYSLKVNKIYLPQLVNNNNNINNNDNRNYNETLIESLETLKENVDFPLKISELNSINESFIQTKNINSEQYTITLYLGRNKQYFRLLLSTIDDYITVSSINCKLCNVTHKYNPILSKTNKATMSQNNNYHFIKDSCFIPLESMKNNIIQKKSINIKELNFKVIDFDSSGFLNSDLIDGILGLNYNNNSASPNKNLIRELYNKGYISSPSFSIVITSSNINRLYLGDIMENEYIKNYLKTLSNKGECKIIEDNWKCKVKGIEHNALDYFQWEIQRKLVESTLSFNLKENNLIIPESYYDFMIVGYHTVSSKKSITKTKSNKICRMYDGIVYCHCVSLNAFGIVTFYFENNLKLDLDIRDYVSYNESAFYFN